MKTFSLLTLTLLPLLLAGPADARSRPIIKTAARYKVPLPLTARVKVSVDALDSTLVLKVRGKKRRQILLKALSSGLKKTPCPDVQLRGREVVVTCRTRKLSARVLRRDGERLLVIYQLRGTPTHAGASRVPLIPFDPALTHDLGGACPGDTVSGRAECALIRGDRQEAEALFRASLGTVNQGHAAVRLGDLSLEDGDVGGAVSWWRQSPRTGPWGRLARARICDVVGTCFDPLRPGHRYDPLDPVALPGALYDDIVLRRARALVFEGRAREASRFLIAPGPSTVNSRACRYAVVLCQRVAVAAFLEAGQQVARSALVLHSQLSGHHAGRHALAIAEHAATHADRLGAPLYGANALAAVTGLTTRDQLANHLARTADLYLRGKDIARARIVLKFARARFKREMAGGPWPGLYQRLGQANTHSPVAPDTLVEDDDVARARALLARLADGGPRRGKSNQASANKLSTITKANPAAPDAVAAVAEREGLR